jgi:dipeptidase
LGKGWTVPGRLVPKNTIVQPKWKIEGEGALQRLVRKVKHRVSTDDSIEATDLGATGGAPQSRNNGMDREDWDEAALPSIQTLGEAVAVVRSIASGMGFVAAQAVLERIALWALDLSNAYREIEVNRTDW